MSTSTEPAVCPRCDFENLAESTLCTGCGHRFKAARSGPAYERPASAWLPAILSLVLPGVGQWRLGRAREGVILLVGFLGGLVVFVGALGHPLTILLLMGLFGVQLYSAVDAYMFARAQAGEAGVIEGLQASYLRLGILLAAVYLSVGMVVSRDWATATIVAAPRYGYLVPDETLRPGDKLMINRRAYRNRTPEGGEIVVHREFRRLGSRPPIVMAGGVAQVLAVSGASLQARSILMKPDGTRQDVVDTVALSRVVGRAVAIYYPIARRRRL